MKNKTILYLSSTMMVIALLCLGMGLNKYRQGAEALQTASEFVESVDGRIKAANESLEEMKNLCRQWTAEAEMLTYPDYGNDQSR